MPVKLCAFQQGIQNDNAKAIASNASGNATATDLWRLYKAWICPEVPY